MSQVDEVGKNPSCLHLSQHWQTLAKELEVAGQDNRLLKKFPPNIDLANEIVLSEQVA